MLSAVLETDGQLLSASQARHRALADADHLAILNAIWTAEPAQAREQRYHDLLMQALPPGYRTEPGHQARWLWRRMRAAELAGLDALLAIARRARRARRSRTTNPPAWAPGSRNHGAVAITTKRSKRPNPVRP